MIRLTSWCTFVVLWMVLTCSANAQSRDNDNSPAIDSGAVATGVTFARPGEWTQLRNIVRNPTDADVTLTVTNTLGKAANVQFGTTLWLPANSRRVVDIPARVMDHEDVKPRSGLPIQTLLLSPSAGGGEKSWLSRQIGQVLVEGNSLNISILGQSDDQTFDLVSKVRVDVEGEKGVRSIRSEVAPFTVEAWDPLSAVVIAHTPDLDARQMHAFRSWILGGGRVWLMLEDVDPLFISQLLGDMWDVTLVDKTRLSRVTFGRTKQAGDEYVEPVTLVRTLPGSAEVLSKIGQWPAAMSIPMGKGEVVVTTLSARAWMTKQASSYMEQVGERLLVRQGRFNPVEAAAVELAATRIGRPIVGRAVVLVVLVTMVLLMMAAGVAFYRMGRLEWMGAAAPAMAVVTALILLGIGKAKQGEVPLTISTVSVVTVTPELGHGVVRGSTAVYSPSMEEGPLQATAGGMIWPDFSGLQGKVVRLLVSDLDKWKWQGVEFSSGVIRTGSLKQDIRFDKPVVLTGQFAEQGLQINANLGQFDSIRDVLLATPGGVMSLNNNQTQTNSDQTSTDQTSQKTYLATPANVLAPNQFVSVDGAIMSEEQQQRQTFYSQLFNNAGELPDRPNLIGWVKNLQPGLMLEDDFEEQSVSLVMIPVTMRRPTSGQKVLVPSTFMKFDVVKVPGERASATIYNRITGEWIPVTNPTRVALAFTLPESVRPMEIESATFTMAISAPGRTVDLLTREGLKGEPAYSVQGPTRSVTYVFTGASKLKADAKGQVLVIVRVGDTLNSDLWKISQVSLQVQGQVR